MAVKLLIVDDSKVMRQMIMKTLFEGSVFKPDNCTVVEASDGAEGLELFKSEKPNLVLSDWNMPNMGGLAMIKAIRKLDKHVPVFMISEESTDEKIQEATSGGLATSYFVKPLTPGALEEKLMAFYRVRETSGT